MKAQTWPSGRLANGANARKIAPDTSRTVSASRRSRRPAGKVERKTPRSCDVTGALFAPTSPDAPAASALEARARHEVTERVQGQIDEVVLVVDHQDLRPHVALGTESEGGLESTFPASIQFFTVPTDT